MSGAINAALNFLTSHWIVLLSGVAGGFLLIFVGRVLQVVIRDPAPGFSGPRSAGGPDTSQMSPVPVAVGRGGDPDDPQRERRRFQSIINDLREDKESLKERILHLTQLNAIVAPLIKELNANVDRRRMGPIVLRVLKRIFEPRQTLVFFLEPDGEILTLVASHGVEDLSEGFQQVVGEGFAGVVAKKRVLMTKADLRQESNLIRQKIQESEPDAFKTDIATPILYRGNVLGVLCIGGLRATTEDDRAVFGMVGDMTALALTNYLQYRKIQELANSDPMTRIYNKGYFLELCDYELAMATRDDRPMTILMFDLDHFKHYNDTNGHLAGDRLLTDLASLLKSLLREEDTIARFGGEEFIVLLNGVEGDEALQAAERIRAAIAEHAFPHAGTQPLGCISASVGLASLPEHGTEMEELIEKADEALYAAKKAGRNRVMSASVQVEVIDF